MDCEQSLGDSEGQGSLAYCSLWCCKQSDTTEQLTNHHPPPFLLDTADTERDVSFIYINSKVSGPVWCLQVPVLGRHPHQTGAAELAGIKDQLLPSWVASPSHLPHAQRCSRQSLWMEGTLCPRLAEGKLPRKPSLI